jgi:putative peptidoglycan lipid II flippase
MPGVVIKTIAPSLPEPTASLAVRLVKWLSFLVLGIALFNVLSSVFNALHHFRIPAITDLTSNLCVVIALVVFSSLWGISALAIGLIGGTYLVIFFLIFHLSKKGFIGINMVFTSNEFKQLIIFSAPILGYLFFSQVSVVIENFFASSLKVGSISALGYARQISNILPTLMATNIAKATFPTFSTLYLEHKIEGLRDLVVKLTKQVIIYFIPTSFVLVFFRKEIIRMVYMRGAFDASALNLTSTAFLFYAAGLTVYVLLPIFIRLCYAFSDAFSPLMATIIGIVCMSLLNYLLTPVWGIMGIAFSSSLAVLLT